MELRALAAEEVPAALGFRLDAGGLPRPADVATILRSLAVGRGTTPRRALVSAAARLCAPHLRGDPRMATRAEAVLRCLTAAGELLCVEVAGEAVCWGRPARRVAVGDGATALVGLEPLDEIQLSDGESVIRRTAMAIDAEPLADHLGPPTFRAAMRTLGAVGWREAAPEDLAAAAAGGGDADAAWPSELAAWVELPTFAAGVVEIAAFEALPPQVRAALALGAEPLSDALDCWRLSPGFATLLADWLGRRWLEPEEAVGGDLDPQQEAVAAAPVDARLVVEAGPGSGKTRVACSRVARLIEAGASPTRIWLVSFTQAAVAELRARIGGFMEEPATAGDVRILTLDSLAGAVRHGFGDEEVAAGFEAGIDSALELVASGNRGLLGFLGGLEHLLVDEAQDLTGARRALVLAVVKALPAGCGVTVFQDSAQAIYGFNEADGGASPSLAEAVLADGGLNFRAVGLERDHRTRDPELAGLVRRLRERLRAGEAPAELYAAVRADIETSAPAASLEEHLPVRSSMVLFRWRAELLSAATRAWSRGAAFRLRMAGRTPVVAPWIGAVLAAAAGDELLRGEFDGLWDETWPRPNLTADEAWRALRSAAGAGRQDRIDLVRLARRVTSPSPPLGLTLTAMGRTGALLSTIHGAKGREAEHVVLALPRTNAGGRDPAEEARVLFVGASRARSSLSVTGSRPSFARKVDGRLWSRWRDQHARIEIGLDGDVDASATVTGGQGESSEAAAARQARLWASAERTVPTRAVLGPGGLYELLGDGGDLEEASLGYLSAELTRSLRHIGRTLHGGALPGRTLKGLFVVGARTCHIPPDTASGQAGAAGRLGLVPVVIGLPGVFFNPRHPEGAPAVEAP